MKHTTIFLCSLLCLTACKRAGDLFTSYGKEVTKTRLVGEYTGLEVGEKFDVLLIQDSALAGRIDITAGEHVIDGYTTEVKNGTLYIQNSNQYNWVRKLQVRQKVVLYLKQLNDINIKGSAKISSQDTLINTSELRIQHNGLEDAHLMVKGDYVFIDAYNTGGVVMAGKCFMLSASADDISYIDARYLNAEKCYMVSFSKDDSYVFGRSVLDLQLRGTGNLYYKDSSFTQTQFKDLGEGKIIPLP
jgi:hypothetical protein